MHPANIVKDRLSRLHIVRAVSFDTVNGKREMFVSAYTQTGRRTASIPVRSGNVRDDEVTALLRALGGEPAVMSYRLVSGSVAA